MQLVQYLLSVATRHEQAKDEHEDELKEYWLKQKKKSRRSVTLTFDDELALLKGVIGSVRGKPQCLKKLTPQAIGSLAYILKAKISNESVIEGHEIVSKLVCDPEKTLVYLNSFVELRDLGWIRFIDLLGSAFTDQAPLCWLPALVEFGETFHRSMGVNQDSSRSFTSNDAYLDAVFAYLQVWINDGLNRYRVSDPETDLSTMQPEGWFRKVEQRLHVSTCDLPAVKAREKYSLSIFQHLAMVGLLGMREKVLRHDFSDPSDVSLLFAIGRICRQRMKDHLFGEQSPLIRQRLLEGTQGEFGESVRLTQLGIKALIGKQSASCTIQELKIRVKKNTLFDLEEPKVKKESVLLPAPIMESIHAILFSESPKGQEFRKNWHASLPSAWGCPTGSTVLLYGPPGTGKTLSGQLIASELSVPLLKVDSARILSCWVGESEQNVRRIFDDYSSLQKDFGKSPVLLLNEADQLLGSRDAGYNATDRMSNNMQNLFLEGLERFSGILVATTNRRDLLDEAFSRRFTYKIELPPPDRCLRIALWKSHLPMDRLSGDVEIEQLADLGLTGGEIRLVIERTVRLMAYRGITSINHKTLEDIAKEEIASRMKRNGKIGKIGF